MCNFPDLNRFLLKPDLSGKAGVEHVEAWLEYRAGKLMYDGKKVTDPDSSDTARCFYKIMWEDFLKNTGFRIHPKLVCHDEKPKVKYPNEDPKKYVQGDWMCSVWTTLKRGLELTYEKNHGGNLWKQEPYMSSLYRKCVTKRTYAEILNHFDKFSEVFEDTGVQTFIRLAYTYANLIIVPDGFNAARNLPTKDYWDETLKLYFNNQKALQCKTKKTKKEDEIISYNGGKKFHELVKASRANGSDSLFLDEWLDKDKDDKSRPLPDKELTTLDEWRALMQEMTERIKERRNKMDARINELMKQQH